MTQSLGTLTIPTTSLPNGDSLFGPVTVDQTTSQAEVNIDRTVAGGMNSKTAATTLTFRHEFSIDGGATFPYIGTDGPIPGGPIIDQDTQTAIPTSSFGCSLPPQNGATSRQARLRITVVGGPVTVAGTLVTS